MLIISSIFMSYQVTVYASEKNVTFDDLLEDALYVALSALGIYGYVQSGGVLNLSVLMPFIYSIAGEGVDLHDYITQDETAGTTTISADFINLVLQAYKQYKEENGEKFDGTLNYDDQTMRYIYGNSEYHLSALNNTTYDSHISGFESYYPVAFLLIAGTTEYKYSRWGTSRFDPDSTSTGYGGFLFYYNLNPDASNNGIELVGRFPDTLVKKPTTITYNNGVASDSIEGFSVQNISGPGADAPYFVSFNSSTIPVYTSFDMMKEAFHSGDYSHAENYSAGVSSGETPSYTGEYKGGDITVLTDKLEGLRKQIEELEKTNKSLEEKLKELLKWLELSGGGNGSGGGDVIVDIDLTETNGLLSKILAKVTQIFDKLSETATGAVDTVNTKLQETLDEILSTLKSIRRWTIADTVFDGIDTVADVASFLKDFLTAPAAAIGTAASSLGETANMLTDKFPFSIPWDMAALVTLLSAEPQAPVFKLPITIESAGIEEYMEIDMSQFEYLSTLMRGMLSILYAYGILSMTTKVMDIGGKK